MRNISIVMPAFNEEGSLEYCILSCLEILPSLTTFYEVLIVNDGSTDRTFEIAEKLRQKNNHIRVIHHKRRLGIGSAIRDCLANANGNLIFLTPADGQQDIGEIRLFLESDGDIVIGHRKNRAEPPWRAGTSKVWNLFIRLLFGLKVKDINWVKLFKREVIGKIPINSTSAFIDAEILIKAEKKGYRLSEVSVGHYPRISGRTKCLAISIVWKAVIDAMRLWIQLH